MASLAIGPAAPLHLGRNLLLGLRAAGRRADRERRELFAVVAVIYALCLLVSGWRRHRRGGA